MNAITRAPVCSAAIPHRACASTIARREENVRTCAHQRTHNEIERMAWIGTLILRISRGLVL